MEELKRIFLFGKLPPPLLEELEKFAFPKRLKAGQMVFLEGEEPKYLHILLEGKAKVYRITPEGNEFLIHRFEPVSLIAEMANIKGIPFPANCAMETDGVVLKIDFERFKKFLKEENICLALISSLMEKINLLYRLLESYMGLSVEERIARLLLENPRLFEEEKHYRIAQMLNIRPETLSRKLKKFRELGVVEKRGKRVVVKDREKLKKLLEGFESF